MDDGLKVVRSVCLFTKRPFDDSISRLEVLSGVLAATGFTIQTLRLCSPDKEAVFDLDRKGDGSIFFSIGRLSLDGALSVLDDFCNAKNVAFNIDLTAETITTKHVEPLRAVTRRNASKTFNFTYAFNNAASSPFFPSASYERDGFAIGLQPTNLARGCTSIDEWLHRLEEVWSQIDTLFDGVDGYLGVDKSIAPLFAGESSLVNFLNLIGLDFSRAVTTDVFLKMSRFIRAQRSKSVGLCGLMFPCLEDFELADEYERGNFTVERCLFLSLQSGLGLDSYPAGIDEDPERIADILRLVQGLSVKHGKPLSARFISDGIARIGDRTDLRSPYLKDVTIRAL